MVRLSFGSQTFEDNFPTTNVIQIYSYLVFDHLNHVVKVHFYFVQSAIHFDSIFFSFFQGNFLI